MGEKRRLRYKIFKSSMKTWEDLFTEASDFANTVGEMNVQSITTSCDHNVGVVTVWYWVG